MTMKLDISRGLRALEDELIARGAAERNESGKLTMLPIRVPFRVVKHE